jgi:hypothetical protein
MNIKNYNSTLSLSNYNLGGAYTFYVHNINLDRLTNANEETVKKYSSQLTEVALDNSYSHNDGKYLNFTRVIGIVVEKHKAKTEKDIDKITVMFRTEDDRYVLNKYVVNSHDIFTNNKNSISPSAVLRTA